MVAEKGEQQQPRKIFSKKCKYWLGIFPDLFPTQKNILEPVPIQREFLENNRLALLEKVRGCLLYTQSEYLR
jgi:hypothetical protein